MNRIWKMIMSLAAGAALLSCEPESVVTRFAGPAGPEAAADARAELPLVIGSGPAEAAGTKAPLLKDVETKGSGALVLVFRTATRQLDSYRFFTQEEIRNQASVPLKLRVPLERCDFYILGNLNGIHKKEGRAANLVEALGAAFPVSEAELEALVYRLDGGSLNDSWRRERFQEVAGLGIPYMHVRKGVDTAAQLKRGQGIPDSDQCRRLFSKVTLRIDHSALDGAGAHPEYFVNSKLYLRQANARLQPFSETPQKAAEAADVLAQSDYDPEMASASATVTTYSFYVPENMQGTLLPGNTDSRGKTRDALMQAGRSAAVPYLTYVELSGRVDPGAGGYGGGATYRFYLGADNCSNFDLARGREYEIRLTFRIGSLFESDWKVELDGWSDQRLFCLTVDPAYTTDIGTVRADRMLAVRSGRPGAFYVYMNAAGKMGGTNALGGKQALPSAAFTPASLADCAWWSDLLRSGSTDAKWLSDRGIKPEWDASSGRLKFSVTGRTKFNAHIGDERTFTLRLLPGGGEVQFKLRLFPEISVKVGGGLSLTDGFYLGQKRSVTISGFAGTKLCYAADQDPCGKSSSGQGHTANCQWKPTAKDADAFPTARLDAAGDVLLDPAAYPSQRLAGTTLDVYAFYPNRFQPSHSGWSSKDGRIIFFSEDWLNDSVEVPVRISEPLLKVESGNVFLPVDGNEVVTQTGWWTFDGSSRLAADSFDPTLLASRLGLGLRSANGTHTAWMSCLKLDPATGRMYVFRTTSGTRKMEDLSYSRVNGAYSANLGTVQVYPLKLSDLYGDGGKFPLRVSRLEISRLKSGLRSVFTGGSAGGAGVLASNYFNTDTESQLTGDTAFGISADFSFLHGDLSRVNWERSGEAMSYTCRKAPYQRVEPVIDFVVDTPDSGSGGSFSWVYDESHQVMESSAGEPVPGGLVIPYGLQTMTGTVTNKWDGRSMTTQVGFRITYPSINSDLLIVARSGQAKASVYLMPLKISKYLKRIGSSVDRTARHWMMQLFGSSDWMSKVSAVRCYQVSPGTNSYYVPGPRTGVPATDYDVKYAWHYLHGNTDVTVWTQSILNEVAAMPNSAVFDAVYLKSEDYPSEYFDGLYGIRIPEGKVCIFWTGAEAF